MTTSASASRKFDVRTLERNIKHGVLSRKQVEEHLAGLPDVSNKAVSLAAHSEDTPRTRSPRPAPPPAAAAGADAQAVPAAGGAPEVGVEAPEPPRPEPATPREPVGPTADESAGGVQ